MKIRNQEDFIAGLMFVAFGILFAVVGSGYSRGTAGNMGPGYVPVALGVIVIVLGTVIAAGACSRRTAVRKVERIHWLLVLAICGPIILFGVLLPYLGLILSVVMVVGCSSLASHEFSWRSTLASATVLSVLSWVLFVRILGLPFPVWPSFVTG